MACASAIMPSLSCRSTARDLLLQPGEQGRLPIHTATNDHSLGICIWEGESVQAVREVVEGANFV